jgi:putative spermidine/putrescine transport system ATP-binding protein
MANTQVAEALHRVGLEGFADRLPSQLSGGQQQRVALARALVYKPPLLLLDEPLGALDKQLRQNMQLEIMRLHRQIGTAMLYVTHDQDEALIMSDRIVVFNHGRIQQIGTPVELYEKPQTRFVAGFIGESSFIPGIITARSGAEAIIRTGCGDLRGRSTTQEPIGHSAVLAVRPEKITIGIEQGVDVNNVDARITDFAYIGQHCKVIARLNDGTEITSLAPASHVASGIFCPGKEIKLSWSADDCSVLADDRKQKAIA